MSAPEESPVSASSSHVPGGHKEFAEELRTVMHRASWNMPEHDGLTTVLTRHRAIVTMGNVSVERLLERQPDFSTITAELSLAEGSIKKAETKGELLKGISGVDCPAPAWQAFFGDGDSAAHQWVTSQFDLNIEDPNVFKDTIARAYKIPNELEGLSVVTISHARRALEQEKWRSSLYMVLTEQWGVRNGSVQHKYGAALLHFARSYTLASYCNNVKAWCDQDYMVEHRLRMYENDVFEQGMKGGDHDEDFRWLHRMVDPQVSIATPHLPIDVWRTLLFSPLNDDQAQRRWKVRGR